MGFAHLSSHVRWGERGAPFRFPPIPISPVSLEPSEFLGLYAF